MEGESRSEDEALRAPSFSNFKMKFLLSAGENKQRLIYPIHMDLWCLKTAAIYFPLDREIFVLPPHLLPSALTYFPLLFLSITLLKQAQRVLDSRHTMYLDFHNRNKDL